MDSLTKSAVGGGSVAGTTGTTAVGTSPELSLLEHHHQHSQQLIWWERFQQQQASVNRTLLSSAASFNQHHHQQTSTPTVAANSDVMNQLCRVCGEPAAGFHFGAFTCEGCKSFFGRTYNNLSSISECKNGGQCVINKKNRTSCKACRLRKCLVVGMSKSGSRYGRRSNWFKIHCLLQEQSNNNNNTIIQQSGVTSSPNNHHPSSLDSKLISKHNENSSSSWTHKKSSMSESPPIHAPRTTPLPDLRSLPDLRNYGGSENAASLAAAAAAFWASRGTSLLPHLPSPDLTNPQVPLSPFLASPFTNRSFLFPYLSPPATLPHQKGANERTSTPTTTNSPPLSSSSSSGRSSPNEKIARIFHENNKDTVALTGLALLKSLGPVQEQPMDLSVKPGERAGSDVEERKEVIVRGSLSAGSIKVEGSEVEDEVDGDSDSGCKMEHPGKPSTPLDLTNKI